MKISEHLKEIDYLPFNEQIEAMSKALLSISKQVVKAENPRIKKEPIQTREFELVSEFIAIESNQKWMTIGDIKTNIGDYNLSNTKMGFALKELGITKKRMKVNKSVVTVFFI